MPWIVLLFLRRRSARKELLKLGMSCFSIPHLLKRSLWRTLMLWVCSQTPKRGISPKLLKNNMKGRTRHHKKRFYEGHITSFDQSEKHMVNYDDGDQEILNLANENWELIKDDNTSNPIQESLPSSSDMFDMPLSCFIDSYRHTRKKKKALNVVDDVAVLTPGTESKKIVHSKGKLYRAEERQKRALEIGNELLQHPPSSEEELMEKLDAMGLFSNTKERNFPKTSKEQHERKNSPSQKEALSSVLITKKNDLPKIPKGLLKRKNSLSQEEALDSVLVSKRSDLPKTSKQQCKRKNLPSQEEKSADKVVREHGVHLVGCRVRVWWPRDKSSMKDISLLLTNQRSTR